MYISGDAHFTKQIIYCKCELKTKTCILYYKCYCITTCILYCFNVITNVYLYQLFPLFCINQLVWLRKLDRIPTRYEKVTQELGF